MLLYQKTTKTAGDIIDELSILLKDSGHDIWSESEKLACVKQAVRKLYPDVFAPVIDTSLTTDGTSYQYTIPASMDVLMAVKLRENTSSQYEDIRFRVEPTASANYLQFYDLYQSGLNIKLSGGTRLTVPTSTATALDITVDAEDLLITAAKIELFEMILLDKGKINQFSAREQAVTEVDVQNMIEIMKRDYNRRKGEINSILIMQVTRI